MKTKSLSLYIASLLLIFSCSRTDDTDSTEDRHQTFLKLVTINGVSNGASIFEKQDGQLSILSADTSHSKLIVAEIDRYGNSLNQQIIEFGSAITPGYFYPQITAIQNSNIEITSIYEAKLISLDQNYTTNYISNEFNLKYYGNNSKVVEGDDGYLYITSYPASEIWVFLRTYFLLNKFDKSGSLIATDTIWNESINKGGINFSNIYSINNNIVSFYGSTLTNPNNISVSKIFYAKYDCSSKKIIETHLSNHVSDVTPESIASSLISKNKDLIVVNAPTRGEYDILNYTNIFTVQKINNNLDEIWNCTVDINALRVVPFHIFEGNEGDFIIGGWCIQGNASTDKPFFARVSSNGQLLSSKIFELGNSSQFRTGISTNDGRYLFYGNSRAFGNDIYDFDYFLLKTDVEGNY